MKLPLIKKIEEIKDKIAASTKKLAPKVGGVVAAGVMLLGTSQGLAAQDDAAPRAPYNPRVGDYATATVVNTWEGKNIVGYKHDLVLVDVDGDGRTTDDQRLIITLSDVVKNKPQYILQIGDKIGYIEDPNSILYKQVYVDEIQRFR